MRLFTKSRKKLLSQCKSFSFLVQFSKHFSLLNLTPESVTHSCAVPIPMSVSVILVAFIFLFWFLTHFYAREKKGWFVG